VGKRFVSRVALLIREELLNPAAGCASALQQFLLSSRLSTRAAPNASGGSRKGTGRKRKKERTKKEVDRADAVT
jgi:hypothetical protein